MTRKSNYVIQKAEKSFCPGCHESVTLLCQRDGKTTGHPWFYICFDCKMIAEVGKGPVLDWDAETLSQLDKPI
jgi:hypothetical protein